MSNNDNIDEERNGLWFWIPLVLILLVLFFIIRSCSNDDQLWQSSAPDAASDVANQTTDAVGDALNSAKSTAGGVISDAAKTATGAAGDLASSATTAAENAAATAGNTVSDLASDTANSVTGAAQSAGDVASGVAGSAMDATGDAVSAGGEAVSGAASDALNTAGSAMQATGDTASKLGSAAMDSAGKTADMAANATQANADKVMDIPSGVLQGDVVNLLSSGKLVAGKHYPAGTLHFDSAKAVVGKDDQAILDAITQIAKANPSIMIHLHGHADSSGPDKFNQYVSTQRALGAKNLLINAGVSAQQIETHGHGSDKPVASNDTPEGRWQNRRTEIEIQR